MASPVCCFISLEGKHCGRPATHGTIVMVGNWGTSCHMCEEHSHVLEVQMPTMPDGSMAVQIMGPVRRAPIIFKLDEIPENEGQNIPVTLTCDRCGQYIYRLKTADGVIWTHLPDDEGNVDKSHEALPG